MCLGFVRRAVAHIQKGGTRGNEAKDHTKCSQMQTLRRYYRKFILILAGIVSVCFASSLFLRKNIICTTI